MHTSLLNADYHTSMLIVNYKCATIVKARKGLVALKTIAAARMSQTILVILYQAVINYGFGLLILSADHLKRLESIQNEV